MIEEFEFRLPERRARMLGPAVQRALARAEYGVVKIKTARDDELFREVERLDRKAKARGVAFIHYWEIRRRYTQAELSAAPSFRWLVTRAFEPIGEECGTVYDYSRACPWCMKGRRRISPLRLRRTSLPRGQIDAARTISDEVVVSDRWVNCWGADGMSGASFGTVEDPAGAPISGWFSLDIETSVEVASPPTTFGDDPWTPARPTVLCPLGHVAGRNITSELTIRRPLPGDLAVTSVNIGHPGATVGAAPMLVVSPRLRQRLEKQSLRVGRFERAPVLGQEA